MHLRHLFLFLLLFAAHACAQNCPPCHFRPSLDSPDCVQVPVGTDPLNHCGGGGPAPKLFCGIHRVCGVDAVCQLSSTPLCNCDFRTGVCAPEPESMPAPPSVTPAAESDPETVVRTEKASEKASEKVADPVTELHIVVSPSGAAFFCVLLAANIVLVVTLELYRRPRSKPHSDFDIERGRTEPKEHRVRRRRSTESVCASHPSENDVDSDDVSNDEYSY